LAPDAEFIASVLKDDFRDTWVTSIVISLLCPGACYLGTAQSHLAVFAEGGFTSVEGGFNTERTEVEGGLLVEGDFKIPRADNFYR
jgi:hypothetical protein